MGAATALTTQVEQAFTLAPLPFLKTLQKQGQLDPQSNSSLCMKKADHRGRGGGGGEIKIALVRAQAGDCALEPMGRIYRLGPLSEMLKS